MQYLDFNPKPVVHPDTNLVHVVRNMYINNDKNLLVQSSSIFTDISKGAESFFLDAMANFDEELKDNLKKHEERLGVICKTVAEFVTKEYDKAFTKIVEKERSVTVAVPKVRKVGLFKKEEYIEHETKIEKYQEEEDVAFKGWRIERLFRTESYGPSAPEFSLFFDYYLGADGNLYLVVHSQRKSPNSEVIISDPNIAVLKCIVATPILLAKPFFNIFFTAAAGVLGALDAIPILNNHPLRQNHLNFGYEDGNYFFNFPIQIDDQKNYPYPFLEGVITRLFALLDNEVKDKCLDKIASLLP